MFWNMTLMHRWSMCADRTGNLRLCIPKYLRIKHENIMLTTISPDFLRTKWDILFNSHPDLFLRWLILSSTSSALMCRSRPAPRLWFQTQWLPSRALSICRRMPQAIETVAKSDPLCDIFQATKRVVCKRLSKRVYHAGTMMAHVSIGRFQPTFFFYSPHLLVYFWIFLACLTKDRSTAAKGPPNNTWWARPSPATHPAVPAPLAASAPAAPLVPPAAPLVPPAVPPRHRWLVAPQPLPRRPPRPGRWYPPAWDLRPGHPLNPPWMWMAASWTALWRTFDWFFQNGWSSMIQHFGESTWNSVFICGTSRKI